MREVAAWRGELVARLGPGVMIGLPVGRNTLIRAVRALADPAVGTVEVLGVDDFAIRRGALDAIQVADQFQATADWLTLELHLGLEFNANMVIGIAPDAEHEIWGSDSHAQISLSGENPDWELVHRIWSALGTVAD